MVSVYYIIFRIPSTHETIVLDGNTFPDAELHTMIVSVARLLMRTNNSTVWPSVFLKDRAEHNHRTI
jgi:hypothetical protein